LGKSRQSNLRIEQGREALAWSGHFRQINHGPYDPCLACATHSLPGDMPMEITVRSPEGEVLDRVVRD